MHPMFQTGVRLSDHDDHEGGDCGSGDGERVTGHGSRVTGHGSRVTGGELLIWQFAGSTLRAGVGGLEVSWEGLIDFFF